MSNTPSKFTKSESAEMDQLLSRRHDDDFSPADSSRLKLLLKWEQTYLSARKKALATVRQKVDQFSISPDEVFSNPEAPQGLEEGALLVSVPGAQGMAPSEFRVGQQLPDVVEEPFSQLFSETGRNLQAFVNAIMTKYFVGKAELLQVPNCQLEMARFLVHVTGASTAEIAAVSMPA